MIQFTHDSLFEKRINNTEYDPYNNKCDVRLIFPFVLGDNMNTRL
jgi:hypothetical protein